MSSSTVRNQALDVLSAKFIFRKQVCAGGNGYHHVVHARVLESLAELHRDVALQALAALQQMAS